MVSNTYKILLCNIHADIKNAVRNYINNFSIWALFKVFVKVLLISFIVGFLTYSFLTLSTHTQMHIIIIFIGNLLYNYTINKKNVKFKAENFILKIWNNIFYVITYVIISRIVFILMFTSMIAIMTYINYESTNFIISFLYFTPFTLVINSIFEDWFVILGINKSMDYNLIKENNLNYDPLGQSWSSSRVSPGRLGGSNLPNPNLPNPNIPAESSILTQLQSRRLEQERYGGREIEQINKPKWDPFVPATREEVEEQLRTIMLDRQEAISTASPIKSERRIYTPEEWEEFERLALRKYFLKDNMATKVNATEQELHTDLLRRLMFQEKWNRDFNLHYCVYSKYFPESCRMQGNVNAYMLRKLREMDHMEYIIKDNKLFYQSATELHFSSCNIYGVQANKKLINYFADLCESDDESS